MSKLKSFAVSLAIVGGLYSAVVFAQTVFSSLRVNGQSDLRGNIVNGAGDVNVADTFNVNAGGGPNEIEVTTGLVTVPGNLTVTGTCTGCGGGGGSPGGADTELQFNNGGAFGGIPEFTYDPLTSIFTIGSQLIDWTLVGVAGATNDFGSGFSFTGGAGDGSGTGGGFYVTGGEGGSNGDGAPINMWSGNGGVSGGNGGGVDIRGGNAQGGDGDGGSISLTPGNGDGVGVNGAIILDGNVSITGSCTGCGGAGPMVAFKTSGTSRTNDTVAADPDLLFSSVPVGRYKLEGYIGYVPGPGNVRGSIYSSTTANTNNSSYAMFRTESGTTALTGIQVGGALSVVTSALQLNAGNNTGGAVIQGYVIVITAPVNIGFTWAQLTTNATPATIREGSWLELTPL